MPQYYWLAMQLSNRIDRTEDCKIAQHRDITVVEPNDTVPIILVDGIFVVWNAPNQDESLASVLIGITSVLKG